MRHSFEFKGFVWHDIVDATAEDIKWLENEYHFHHLALEDCLSNIQQPKIDDYEKYLFLVLHLPRYIKASQRTVALEIDIFLGKNYLVTLHNGDLKPLNNLFSAYSLGKLTLRNESPAYLLYEILEKSFNYCFPMLEKIGQKLDLIEDDLYEDQSRKTLEEISVITQDVINFRRVIKPQRFFVNDLENTDLKFIDDKLDIYFDDIADKIERIWELLDNYKEVCDVLQRTNESILTQRLNEVMKTLTIITVIMLPLTVITGFYGMNIVGLPAAMHKYAAEIIIGIMMVVGFGMLYWFKKRNWL